MITKAVRDARKTADRLRRVRNAVDRALNTKGYDLLDVADTRFLQEMADELEKRIVRAERSN